jgi:pyruvate/oxaloacetate carboxyltransferase
MTLQLPSIKSSLKKVKYYLFVKYVKPTVDIDDVIYERLLGETNKITNRPVDLIPNELVLSRLRYLKLIGED